MIFLKNNQVEVNFLSQKKTHKMQAIIIPVCSSNSEMHYYHPKNVRGTQRKVRDIVIHNIICSSELARMCGMSYISQLGSVQNTHFAARNPILQRILRARSTNKRRINQLGKILILVL